MKEIKDLMYYGNGNRITSDLLYKIRDLLDEHPDGKGVIGFVVTNDFYADIFAGDNRPGFTIPKNILPKYNDGEHCYIFGVPEVSNGQD